MPQRGRARSSSLPYLVQGAAVAPAPTAFTSSQSFRRIVILLTALALAVTLIAIESPSATFGANRNGRTSEAQRVIRYARSHLGARFRIGTEGRRYFDCSGLVYRVYAQAHLLRKIGGSRKLAAGYYRWFRSRGLVGRSHPRPGDLVWWTKHGRIEHMGIYVGGGRAISALTTGVKRHRMRSISVKFKAYGHVRLDR
jgi:cell wall-associated NlpC family hydrolase